MQFEYPPAPINQGMHHMHARRTSMPCVLDSNSSLTDVTQQNLNQANRAGAGGSISPGQKQRRLSKKSKSDANLSRLTSQERKVDNLPRKAKSRLYKSELCKAFMKTGHCKYGGKCQYAHGEAELRFVQKSKNYKTIPCKTFWATGFCKYGNRCCFLHNDLGGGAFSAATLTRAESQPAMMPQAMQCVPIASTPIPEEGAGSEREEDDADTVTPLWSSESWSPGGLDLNSIADSIVEDDEQPQDVMDAFSLELARATARFQNCDDAAREVGQRLGRELSQTELDKIRDALGESPRDANSPPSSLLDSGLLSGATLEFPSLARKHQSMPNVLRSTSPGRTSSRLNVFAQLAEESNQDSNPFAGQAA